MAVLGLACGAQVLLLDAPWWAMLTAGATIATSATVVIAALGMWWAERKEKRVDMALAERVWAEQDGSAWIPPHLNPDAPVPHWFLKLQIRRDLKHGRYVPELYRTPYWAGKWASRDE